MNLSTLAVPAVGRTLLRAGFLLYTCYGFLESAKLFVSRKRAGRLFTAVAPLERTAVPTGAGLLFTTGVLGLIFLRSIFYPLLVILGVVSLTRHDANPYPHFGLNRLTIRELAKWSLLILGATIFLEIPLSALTSWLFDQLRLPHPAQETVSDFRHLQSARDIVEFLFAAVLIFPAIEEAFFRGFLFPFLQRFTSPPAALFLSGGLFALAHENLDALIPLWLLGIILGLAYAQSGSLLLPIAIHGLFNLVTGLTLLLEPFS